MCICIYIYTIYIYIYRLHKHFDPTFRQEMTQKIYSLNWVRVIVSRPTGLDDSYTYIGATILGCWVCNVVDSCIFRCMTSH